MQFTYKSTLFDIKGVSEDDHIYNIIAKSGVFYEIDLLEYIFRLKPYINSKDSVNIAIDIGANIGNHSIFFGTYIVDHLIAIEPNPLVLPQLRRNLSKNLELFTIYERAVGEKQGRGNIMLPETINNNIGAAKIDIQNSEGNIEISTLDSVFSAWIKDKKKPISVNLLKIDVEGMETQVLMGAEDTLIKYRPHIFAEAATSQELHKIYTYLNSLGYKKMPGSWAATPVYHFVYMPSVMFRLIAVYLRFKTKILSKISKPFST